MAWRPCLRSVVRSRWAVSAVALLTASFSVSPAVPSESPPLQQLDLDSVVADILDRNPEINFYRAEIAAAKGGARTAAAWPNPDVSGTAGEKRVTDGGSTAQGLAWSAAVRIVFEWPGRIPLRKAIAGHQIQLAELGFEQFKAALTARLRTLAFGLAVAHEKSAAAREVADRFRALREVVVQREPGAIAPQLEARIMEAAEISMLRRASDAALAEQAAMFELNQLRGVPWAQTIRVTLPELPNGLPTRSIFTPTNARTTPRPMLR